MKKKIIIGCLLAIIASSAFVYKTKERTLVRPNLSTELPYGLDSDYIKKMISLGMNTSKEAKLLINVSQRKYWKTTFGLNFLGEDEMATFLSDNSFILGPADKYKNIVPTEAGHTLAKNFDMIGDYQEEKYSYWSIGGTVYTLTKKEVLINLIPGQTIWFPVLSEQGLITKSAILRTGLVPNVYCLLRHELKPKNSIYIIGAQKDFNIPSDWSIVNDILMPPPPKDPIAVIKVYGGYVELARWE